VNVENVTNIYINPVYLSNGQAPNTLYLRTPFPNGMSKQPYTGTGYYGGLSGPPFLTEVRCADRTQARTHAHTHTHTHTHYNFSGQVP